MDAAKPRPPQIGSNVDAWCTRCKLVLAHTIEAMVGRKITRVHCNTCRAQHAYRSAAPAPRTAARPGSSRPRTGRSSRSTNGAKAPLQASDYERLLRGRDPSKARPYAVTAHFAPPDLIAHPTFGLGLVTAAKEGTKIDVLFPEGLKTLVHCR
jgi:hypothetical protein